MLNSAFCVKDKLRRAFPEHRRKLMLRIILGGVFIVAGISKLIDSQLLFTQIWKIGITNVVIVQIFSYGLIVLELLLGLLLIFLFRKWVAIITGVVLMGFCLFLGYLIYNHDPSSCGCFGNFVHISNKQELLNNLALLMGIIYLY